MIGFDVYLNGKKLCTAGVGDLGVLTAGITWVGHAVASKTPKKRRKTAREDELELRIGGLRTGRTRNDEHVQWVTRKLDVGDEVRVALVRTKKPDRPKMRYRYDPAFVKKREREHYERLREKYGE